MKKILFGLILVLSLVLMPEDVAAKNKVTIYIFRGNTCNHCEEAVTYLNEHKSEIDENIEILTYEVFDNANNSRLHELVVEKLDLVEKLDIEEKEKHNVPLIVIGETPILGYSGVSTYNKMMEKALAYVDDEEYKDVVEEARKELNINVNSKTLDDLFPEPNKVVTIVVYGIFGVIVLGIAAMIIFSRK